MRFFENGCKDPDPCKISWIRNADEKQAIIITSCLNKFIENTILFHSISMPPLPPSRDPRIRIHYKTFYNKFFSKFYKSKVKSNILLVCNMSYLSVTKMKFTKMCMFSFIFRPLDPDPVSGFLIQIWVHEVIEFRSNPDTDLDPQPCPQVYHICKLLC
jgi:hypothetical protein